jgi:tetratricopeptide (TPR) repeat protein
LFLTNIVQAQNNAIRGIVKLQSSGSQPLSDVKISAFGANPVYSNSSGQFELIFANKKPGAAVNLFVLKEGFEVINDKELESVVIRDNPDDLVIIVLAKMGERARQALAYYDIIIDNTNENYKKELKSIQNQLDALVEDDANRKSLRDQIEILQQEKMSLLEKAEELSQQLASVDMDMASDLAQDAYARFKSGDIKSALIVLNDDILEKNLKEAQEIKAKLQREVMKSDSAISQCIENYMIKARFCVSDRNYDEAIRNYKKAIEADSNNVGNLIEAGDFCNNINDQVQAIRFYNSALTKSTSWSVKARLLLELGHQYMYNDNYTVAETSFNQALELVNSLEDNKNDQHQNILADIYMSIGRMYLELNNDIKGEEAYLKSKSIINKLAAKDKSKYEVKVAEVQQAIGNLYSKLQRFEQADSAFRESLDIYKRMAELAPNKYQSSLAASYSGMAIYYARNEKYEDAEEAFLQSINIYEELEEKNPSLYESNLASVKMGLSVMYYHSGQYQASGKGYKETLEIYSRLAEENPRRFEPFLARVYLNMGSLFSTLGDYKQSEETYNTSRFIRKRLAAENPERFDPLYCHVLLNLIFLKKEIFYKQYEMNQKPEALELLEDVKAILVKYDPSLPWVQRYSNNVEMFNSLFEGVTKEDLMVQTEIDSINNIAIPALSKENLPTIISTQLSVIELLKSLQRSHPENQRLATHISEAYGNYAAFHMYNESFEKAEINALLGLKYDKDEIWINSYLALALSHQEKLDQALKVYEPYMDSSYNGYPMKDIFIEDLEALEAFGIVHKNNVALKAFFTQNK